MASEKITAAHVLFPLSLLSFVMALFLGFQTTLLVSDRDTMHQARATQAKQIEQVEKVKAQVNALAVGTLKLAQQGNKDAANIIAELKKSGVDVSDQQGGPQGGPPAGMPGGPGPMMSTPMGAPPAP